MPKQFRLSRAQFELLQRERARRVHGTYFSMAIYKPFDGVNGPKVGFVIPKKIVPRANTRNTIERRGREVFRRLLKSSSTDSILILNCKKGVASAKFDELEQDLSSLFEQAR